MNSFETCEDCYDRICIMDMVVKETSKGVCIYCHKCTERHQFLENQAETLCHKWGIDVEKLKLETEREKRQHSKHFEKKDKKEKRTPNA
jgi:hypothetical protein